MSIHDQLQEIEQETERAGGAFTFIFFDGADSPRSSMAGFVLAPRQGEEPTLQLIDLHDITQPQPMPIIHALGPILAVTREDYPGKKALRYDLTVPGMKASIFWTPSREFDEETQAFNRQIRAQGYSRYGWLKAMGLRA